VKIGPVDPEIALFNLKKEKKEINASKIYSPVGRFAERAKLWKVKYIALLASLPSGLKIGYISPVCPEAQMDVFPQIFAHVILAIG